MRVNIIRQTFERLVKSMAIPQSIILSCMLIGRTSRRDMTTPNSQRPGLCRAVRGKRLDQLPEGKRLLRTGICHFQEGGS